MAGTQVNNQAGNQAGKPNATKPAAGTPGKRGRKPAPVDETKAQRFKRLAVPRVNATIKGIRAIGNLSGSAYECTPEDIAKIAAVLHAEIDKAVARFSATKAESKDCGFEL